MTALPGFCPPAKKSTTHEILISEMSNFTGISFWGLGTTRGGPQDSSDISLGLNYFSSMCHLVSVSVFLSTCSDR